MATLTSGNLTILFEMLSFLSNSSAPNCEKFEKLKNVILTFFDSDELWKLHEYCEDLNNEDLMLWGFEKLSDEPTLKIINQLPLLVNNNSNQVITLPELISKIRVDRKVLNASKNIVTDTLCILTLFGTLSLYSDSLLDDYEEEWNYLINNNIYRETHQSLFYILLCCREILENSSQTHILFIERFNQEYYYSLSITHLTSLNQKIYKISMEAQEKTQHIYSRILEIVGLLIAIFSIIGVNCFALSSQDKIEPLNIVVVNCSVLMCISLLMFFVHNILHKGKICNKLFFFFIFFTLLVLILVLVITSFNEPKNIIGLFFAYK